MEDRRHIILPSGDDVIGNVIPLLFKEGNDYSKNLVIFPNKRPALYLKRAISLMERKPFVPPVIMSVDEFIDYIYEEILGVKDIKIDMIDGIAIIHDLLNKDVSLDEFFSTGQRFFNDFEELKIEDVDDWRAGIVDLSVREQLSDRLKERLMNFSELYKNFYEEIEKRGLSTRSLRYQRVAKNREDIKLEFKKIIICGIYEVTVTESYILKKLLLDERTALILRDGRGIENTLRRLNIEHRKKENHEPMSCISIYRSPDLHGEVLSVAKIVREIFNNSGDRGSIAFVLPSQETLFPFYHNVLCMFSPDEYNISLSYSLHRTPLYTFFETLIELISSTDGEYIYIPYYLDFILHPYTKNIKLKGSSEYSRILFHILEMELTKRESRRFMTINEILSSRFIEEISNELSEYGIDADDIKMHIMTIHENIINKMENFKDIGDFAKRIVEIIKFIYNESTARDHPFFFPYSNEFIEKMERLSRSFIASKSFMERESYFRLFKKYISTCYMPFEKSDPLKEIQVLGFLETRNLKFDTLFIMDVNEGIIPSGKKDDTYLSLPVRKMLGIPSYRERERLMEYYFDSLIMGARNVYIHYIENRDMETSRFIEKMCWEIQRRNRLTDNNFRERFIKTVNYPVTLRDCGPRDVQKTREIIDYLRDFRFSATSIDIYKKCSLKFYYEYVLGLEPKSKVSGSVENLEIGNIIHEILKEYLDDKKGKILHAEDLNTIELNSIIERITRRRFGENIFGEVLLIKKQIKNRLFELIENYQKPLAKNHRIEILFLEGSFEVRFNSVRLYAKIDRIEKRDNTIYLIDYKTSSDESAYSISFNNLNKKTIDKAIKSFQLPVYQLVYHLVSGIEPENIIPVYLLLGRKKNSEIEYEIYKNCDNPKKSFRDVIDILKRLIDEILDINRPFTRSEDSNSCEKCDYKTICFHQNL